MKEPACQARGVFLRQMAGPEASDGPPERIGPSSHREGKDVRAALMAPRLGVPQGRRSKPYEQPQQCDEGLGRQVARPAEPEGRCHEAQGAIGHRQPGT